MSTPVLHVLAGPNGSGKSTLAERVLQPVTGLTFVNADVIAAATWPGEELVHAYEASRLAAEERERLLAANASFITETVFSHPSKAELVDRAGRRGYLVHLHVVLVPVDLAAARVLDRVDRGGHAVPEDKLRARFERLWPLVTTAAGQADRVTLYDNARAGRPFRVVGELEHGVPVGRHDLPAWTPPPLAGLWGAGA